MNFFEQTDKNEHGLRSTLKKKSSVDFGRKKSQFWSAFQQPSEEKKVGFDVDEESEAEQAVKPYESTEVNMNTFLYKLSTTVQRIDAYKEHLGLNKGERRMKMQGVLRGDCKIDINKHFAKHNAQAEAKAVEEEKMRKYEESESKTTVGAVKRLI